jgi:dipeptidyl aminopeptidase/acylaminoacyl peptidase
MTPESGVIESHIYEQRLTVVDAKTGEVRQLTPADLYVYEYDWSRDGKNFALTAAHGSGDNNWWIAELYTVSQATGETRSIFKPPADLQLAVPSWSPDGLFIAFIGGIMSDQGSTGGDIYTVPSKGGEAKNVTPGLRASPSWIAWQKPEEILFSENVDGKAGFATLNPASGKVTTLWEGAEAVSSGGFAFYPVIARDGRSCGLIEQSLSSPPEIWAGKIGSWTQITRENRGQHAAWGDARSIHWSSDNFTVQGWLVFPKDYDASRRYPMVVVVHGGPASSARPNWPSSFFGMTLLASQGYFVLMPNPRGSYGQGEAFTRANIKDFGYGDLRDILAGVDEVVKTLPVDNDRVGITGWSYGGFMTMWAITQTNRFHAAVAGAGLSDWLSYYGENDIDQWMIPYFGASVYDDPAVYAKSSPINFIKNVKTPTLILVGDRDGECPVPQSYEYWHALKTLGVDNQFVVYEGEGHFIYKPGDQRDIMRRVLSWFNTKLQNNQP